MHHMRAHAPLLALVVVLTVCLCAEAAASPTKAVFTSFWEYHQARGRANGTPAQASPRVKIASDDGADGSVQSGGYDYGAPSFTATTAGLTVPSCAEDDLIFANLNLQCNPSSSGQGHGVHGGIGVLSPQPSGSCFIEYDWEYPDDWQDASDYVNIQVPGRIGTWTGECTLPQSCAPDSPYGNHNEHTRYRLEGSMWYVEDVYAKNLNCYRLAWDGDDYGLIRACEDRIFDRRAGRDNGPLPNHKRSFTKQSKKRRDRGMQTPVGAAPPLPAEPVKKAEVKIASVVDTANYDSYGDDSNATYYKLDWAWIFVGTMTTYDKTGAVLWRGSVQMVHDLEYSTTGTDPNEAPVPVPASTITNGLVVDCSAVQFEWLDAHTEYTE